MVWQVGSIVHKPMGSHVGCVGSVWCERVAMSVQTRGGTCVWEGVLYRLWCGLEGVVGDI